MNPGLLRALRERLAAQADAELLRLWVENDRGQYSPETFDAVRSLLTERGIALPPQNDPPPMAKRAKIRRSSADVFAGDPGASAWLGWLRAVLWVGAAAGSIRIVASSYMLWWLFTTYLSRRAGPWTAITEDLFTGPFFRVLVVNFIIPLWLLVAAWMGLRLRRHARGALLGYAWAAILATALVLVSNIHSVLEVDRGWIVALAGSADSALPAVYPVLLLLLLTRPQIKELFEPVAGFEVRAAGAPTPTPAVSNPTTPE